MFRIMVRYRRSETVGGHMGIYMWGGMAVYRGVHIRRQEPGRRVGAFLPPAAYFG
jgi:hypothetical protein